MYAILKVSSMVHMLVTFSNVYTSTGVERSVMFACQYTQEVNFDAQEF